MQRFPFVSLKSLAASAIALTCLLIASCGTQSAPEPATKSDGSRAEEASQASRLSSEDQAALSRLEAEEAALVAQYTELSEQKDKVVAESKCQVTIKGDGKSEVRSPAGKVETKQEGDTQTAEVKGSQSSVSSSVISTGGTVSSSSITCTSTSGPASASGAKAGDTGAAGSANPAGAKAGQPGNFEDAINEAKAAIDAALKDISDPDLKAALARMKTDLDELAKKIAALGAQKDEILKKAGAAEAK